ncbi:MAG: CopG family transcriptional regulator [Bacillota bacterium]|nr:CopG family transcriptional regulator [Bacillota bacterium]
MGDKKLEISRKEDDSVVLSIRLKKEIVRQLDDIAQQTNRSRNMLISICLEYALDNIQLK